MSKLTLITPRVSKLGVYYKGLYVCDCGKEVVVNMADVNSGKTTSCGCFRKAATKARFTTHGGWNHTKGSTYNSWASMRARCLNPNNKDYLLYGGRGILICDSWRTDFRQFLQDMGERPEGTSIDRIDPNGNYEPPNCRWATWEVQSANKRKKAA